MKNEKLTAVTNKICELLKGSELDPMRKTDRGWSTDKLRCWQQRIV